MSCFPIRKISANVSEIHVFPHPGNGVGPALNVRYIYFRWDLSVGILGVARNYI